MQLYDCHCHSNHSRDSKVSVREIAENAVKLGFSGVTVTDHYNPLAANEPPERQTCDPTNCEQSFEDILAVREQYRGQIDVLCGVEIGSCFRHADSCARLLHNEYVDEVIGSVHGIKPIFNNGEERGHSPFLDYPTEPDRLVEAYLCDVFRNAVFCDVDVIGHVTYLQRYIIKDGKVLFNVKKFIDACGDIMHAAISRSKAIEINAKSIQMCRDVPFTELEFFKMYRGMGGELVTIGSDAHTLADFAYAEAARDILEAAGFRHACYYKKRQAQFYSIV